MAIERAPADEELRLAVERARRSVVPVPARPLPELSPEAEHALRTLLEDGTYARAAAAVSAEDPDIAEG